MVVAGVTTGHEVRESWNKGEGAQVITIIRRGGLRNAGDRNRPERHLGTYYPKSDHWRARYGETHSAGSGRGRRKRTCIAGTSPAAYFTLWEPGAETLRATRPDGRRAPVTAGV
jgi:hypothetical protein